MKLLYTILPLFYVTFLSLASDALEPHLARLVEWETQFNAIAQRQSHPIPLPHYEIPLRLLQWRNTLEASPKFKASMTFEKNGEFYVRWVVNPEDTHWYLELEKWMQSMGLDTQRHFYFQGYQTASRSYIAEDPKTGFAFSLKSSTNTTGGKWADKKQTLRDGLDIVKTNDMISTINKETPLNKTIIIPDSAVIGIEGIDQAIVLRDLAVLNKNNFYVPGFSALHETLGRHIAQLNGFDDPREFWAQNYVEPMARMLAEFFIKTGIIYDSPHSQNFLIELDQTWKPTGRIAFRDFGDIYVLEKYFKSLGLESYLRTFSAPNNIMNNPELMFGPLHGNKFPSWITQADYVNWGVRYHKEFARALSENTQLPKSYFNSSFFMDEGYFNKRINWGLPKWKSFFKKLRALHPLSRPNRCARSLTNKAQAK